MGHPEKKKLIIDGKSLSDLEVKELEKLETLIDLLANLIPKYPWIAGIVAISAIVWLGSDKAPLVQIIAVICVTLLTAIQSRK